MADVDKIELDLRLEVYMLLNRCNFNYIGIVLAGYERLASNSNPRLQKTNDKELS